MIIEMYLVIVVIAMITTMYSFLYNDKENYTHIISGFLSGVVWMILGYQSYIGIEFQNVIETYTYGNNSIDSITNSVELTPYQYDWMGMLFIIIGVIMVLYTIVQIYNANKELIEELEGKDDDLHEPVR